MDMFAGFHLCEIKDCKMNENEICSVDADFDDIICIQNRDIPVNQIKKEYSMLFDKQDCIELDIHSVSKGAQKKWLSKDRLFLIKERFYYQLRFWNDDLVEVISSIIGRQLGINCLEQFLGRISGRDCSYSAYWGEKRFIPFGKLKGANEIYEYSDVIDRIKFTIDLLNSNTHLDLTDYLGKMTLLDFIVGNEDRHLFNFGVLYDGSGYEVAPLFDFGLGLFEHDVYYKGLSIEQCIQKMSKKPFHDWNQALNYFAEITELPKKTTIQIPEKLLPNSLAEPYLRYSLKTLGMEVALCD